MTNRREQATQLRSRVQEQVDRIRRDDRLTPAGKAEALARAWWPAQQQLAALRQAEVDEAQQQLRSVERRIFGVTPGGGADQVLAARDAAARADATPRAEVEAAYQRAVRRGDALLANALVGRAIETGVRSVVDQATADNPRLAADLDQLDQLAGTVNGGDRTERMTRSMVFGMPAPKEIAGMGEGRIRALVDVDEPQPAGDAA